MSKAGVYNNGILAGILEKKASDIYMFTYDDQYFIDSGKPGICLLLPKHKKSISQMNYFLFFTACLQKV